LHALVDSQDRMYDWYLCWDADSKDHFRVRRGILGKTPDVVDAVETLLAGGSLSDEVPGAYEAKALIAEYGEELLNQSWGVDIGTMTLVADVERAAHRYIADLRQSARLYAAFLQLKNERANEKLKWTPDLP
jgi:hypothetical protein